MNTTVSVIVPTHDRPGLLERCLDCIGNQTFTGSVEVVVLDDGSPDADAVKEAVTTSAAQDVRLIRRDDPGGPATARNQAASQATGDLLAFTDDDTLPRPDWLDALVDAYEEGADVVEGRVVLPEESRPLFSHAVTNDGGEYLTANVAYDRDLFEALGGFCEEFTAAHREDSDLAFAALDADATITYQSRAIVEHPAYPRSWRDTAADGSEFRFEALLYSRHPTRYKRHIRSPLETFSMFYLLVTATVPLVPVYLLLVSALGAVEAAYYGYTLDGPGTIARLPLYGIARTVATWRLLAATLRGCREFDVSAFDLLVPYRSST